MESDKSGDEWLLLCGLWRGQQIVMQIVAEYNVYVAYVSGSVWLSFGGI